MKIIVLSVFTLVLALSLSPAADPPGKAPAFPEPFDSEKNPVKIMPAAEAAKGFKVPPGFKVEVFASEPDVRNPIAMCWDTKGRMWVAENYTFEGVGKKFELALRDRIIIFHDKNGDNKPERKVFTENVQRLTSVEVGLGGVWLMCPPQLLFIPDKNGDDVPDGPPEVVLEGFDIPAENHHNFANGLKWGPDGWLYGRCGASAPGKVRRPDQGPDAAVPLAGGIWRYHPHRKVFEALCHGTTNPWGHDWDAYGECFFINTVNGHLWHMIPGAHYRRPHTISPNPLVYEPMEMIADHWHFDIGKGWNQKAVNDSRNVDATIDKLGGGHAHIGCMIYNGDQWPTEYRGKLFTLNQHGRRINVERLERHGSSYVGKHEPDMFFASDPNFRGMELSQGPDGSVYVLDWNDTGECHDHTGVLRSTGRIYRIQFENAKAITDYNLTKWSDKQLLDALYSDNEWIYRMSQREILHRSSISEAADKLFIRALFVMSQKDTLRNNTRIFNAMCCFDMGKASSTFVFQNMPMIKIGDRDFDLQATNRLFEGLLQDTATSVIRSQKADVIQDDISILQGFAKTLYNSPNAKLAMASNLQRLNLSSRIIVAHELLQHAVSADDDYYGKMIWYGLIPVALQTPEKLVDLAANAKIPLIRKWTARRFAEIIAEKPDCLNALLLKTAKAEESVRRDIVIGISEGLRGIRKAKKPDAWTDDYSKGIMNGALIANVRTLNVIFGDGRAITEVKTVAFDDKAPLEQRKAAVLSLIDANPPELRAYCESLLKVRFLNTVALQGLVKFDDAGIVIAKAYKTFHPSERGSVITALSSRPSFAAVLLKEIETGAIPRTELTASQARQISSFNKPELTATLTKVWGELRESSKDKQDLIAKWKKDLTKETLSKADLSAGRAVYAKTCASCHKLYGAGETIGPDLTGAGRKDMDYLLSNIIDPSAVVTKDFQMSTFQLADGRVLNGIVTAETPATITLQLEKEKLTLPKADIEKRTQSALSLMPDGQFLTMTPEEIRNLIAYLMTDSQVELKK